MKISDETAHTILNKESEIYQIFSKLEFKSTKHTNFFFIYDELLKKYKNKEVTLVEVGIASGGSLFLWQKYFKKNSRIIGIDLNPGSKKWEKFGFEVFIGNQSDQSFWENFYKKVGKVDILIDDGGHTNEQQITTLLNSYENINEDGTIIIEDTHTSYLEEFGNPSKYSFMNFSNKIIDDQNKKSLKDLSTKKYLEKIYKIDNYQSLVAFHVNSLKAQKNQSIMNDGKVIDSEDYRLKDTSIFRGIDKFKNNLRKKCPPKFYQFLKNIYPYFKFLIFKYKNLKNRKFF